MLLLDHSYFASRIKYLYNSIDDITYALADVSILDRVCGISRQKFQLVQA